MAADRPGGLPLRRRLTWLLAGVGAALLILLLLMGASIFRQSTQRNQVVDRYDPAALAVKDLRTALVNQETGIRGFALTGGDERFREPYDLGTRAADAAQQRLDALIGDDADLADELARARAAVAEWRTQVAEPSLQDVVEGQSGIGDVERQTEAKQRFDEVRARLDDLGTSIATDRQEAIDELRAAAAFVTGVVVVVGFVLLVLGIALFVALSRSVTTPIEELGAEVRAVAEGDLTHPVVGAGSPELVQLGVDIESMRRRILDELDRLNEARDAIERQAAELERSNADLEQFAYVASHDLQEPLRKVAGFCQLLERRYKGTLDERADEYIHYAVDGARRMQDLINDLLAFSRVGRTTERFEPIDLDAAVASAIENLALTIEDSGAVIEVGDLPTVQGDRRLLVALFQNLIANGMKFRTQDQPHITVRGVRSDDDDEVTVTVSDNGIGIDPEYGDQIFTLFKRLHTKQEYAGTGIGLALCKRIVEFHGGTIWLDAEEPGPGATFRFTLPLTKELSLV